MYCVQSVTVLDALASENINSLSRNVVIMCTSTVHDVASLCVPYARPFKVCKELFIVNCPSLKESPKLHSNNFAIKFPYRTV